MEELRVPSQEQTQTGLSFRSVWNSFRSTVEALWALTWRRRNETQVDLKLISLSQVGLSFQVNPKFSCEQNNISFRGETTFQNKCDLHSLRSFGNQNNQDFIQRQPAGSKCYEAMPISSTKQSQLFWLWKEHTHCLIFSNRSGNVHVRGKQISRHSHISSRSETQIGLSFLMWG